MDLWLGNCEGAMRALASSLGVDHDTTWVTWEGGETNQGGDPDNCDLKNEVDTPPVVREDQRAYKE